VAHWRIAGVSVHRMNGALEPDADAETVAAVARLSEILPRYAPWLHATLRPSVDEADLAGLRHAVAPSVVPAALVTLLRWADGQRDEQSSGWIDWWPALDCGPLLSATAIIEHYEGILRTSEDWQWSPSWLPITHESWNQAAIELVSTRSAVILDASWPDLPRVTAPSLSAVLQATGDLAEAGLFQEAPPTSGSDLDDWERRKQHILSARYLKVGWKHSPFEPDQYIEPDHWPPDWRGRN
jgi:hypothetical protein